MRHPTGSELSQISPTNDLLLLLFWRSLDTSSVPIGYGPRQRVTEECIVG